MADPLLFSPSFNENFELASLLEVYKNEERRQDFGIEDLEEFCCALGLDQQTASDYFMQNDSDHQAMSQTTEPTNEFENCGDLQISHVPEVGRPIKEKPKPFHLASFELLSSCGRDSKQVCEANIRNPVDETAVCGQSMSMEDILRLAGERCMQFSTQRLDGFSMFIHPYGSAFSGLPMEEMRDVELAFILLLAADKVANMQYDVAAKLITRCKSMASDSGNAIQRMVFYFAESLQDRIDRATGRTMSRRMNERIKIVKHVGLGTNPEFLAWHQKLPFSQVTQMVGTQAIMENVKNAAKIHLIDLEVRSGIQWTAFMQALVERKGSTIEHLKITAIGATDREMIEETGKRLRSFAKSMNLPFSFNVVFLSDMRSIKEFENIEADETVAVYCSSVLRTMISTPDCLDNVMKAVRSARPAVMVVIEVEANHNSPSFLNRFIEALFFHGAVFDCLEECMERNNQHRLTLERIHLFEGIRNIIAAEGEERVNRNVKIDVWRAFFARFRMEELELSDSSIYQANLVLKQFARGDACNLDRNGNGLIIGWKGTPIRSLTTWKFF